MALSSLVCQIYSNYFGVCKVFGSSYFVEMLKNMFESGILS